LKKGVARTSHLGFFFRQGTVSYTKPRIVNRVYLGFLNAIKLHAMNSFRPNRIYGGAVTPGPHNGPAIVDVVVDVVPVRKDGAT